MTISYNWYTTNYRHAAAYATLIVKATVYNKPIMFNWSYKNPLTLFFKFPGRRDKVSKSGTVPDSPGCMAIMSFDRNFLQHSVLVRVGNITLSSQSE